MRKLVSPGKSAYRTSGLPVRKAEEIASHLGLTLLRKSLSGSLRRDSRGYSVVLYFVQAHPSYLIKIGITSHWDARLSAIRRGNSEDVQVLRIFHGSDDDIRELEKELHLELAASNEHHEWFALADPELQEVLTRHDRQFNPELLASTVLLPE